MKIVGYGDISATNPVEAVFLIFMMITICGIFAYSFNEFGFLIKWIK